MEAEIITGVISSLVNLVTGYMTYRVGMKSANEKGTPEPEKPDVHTLSRGEEALEVVRVGVTQYGDEDEQSDLANFERNPTRYEGTLRRVLTDITSRTPAFAQQLQAIAQQVNIQAGGVQGAVNISGEGKVYGPVAGTNVGNMSASYSFGERHDKH